MTGRDKFPGWTLDPDPLTVEPDPEPPRRFGCLSFAVLVLVLVAGVSTPSEARTLAASPAESGLRGVPASPAATLSLRAALAAPQLEAGSTPVADAPPSGAIGTVLLGGYATWYATPGYTAAAGPVLRDVLGDWRGEWITVESGDRSVTLQLTDWCACGERHGLPTLLDLSDAAFSDLTGLDDPKTEADEGLLPGVIRVSIEIDAPPDPRDDAMRDEVRDPLPATDTR